MIERNLIFHLWLEKNNYLKSDFKFAENKHAYRTIHCIRKYLNLFKIVVVHEKRK